MAAYPPAFTVHAPTAVAVEAAVVLLLGMQFSAT
jgi:hypothetical protein